MFYVIDIRDDDIRWFGTKKECKEWISMTNPMNRQYYKLAKENSDGKIELL